MEQWVLKLQYMQLRQTFSIHLPVDLYQELMKKVGKGKISTFIREIVEERLSHEKNCLGRAYQECYANNPHLLKEAKLWERAEIEDWLTYEQNKNVAKKTKK